MTKLKSLVNGIGGTSATIKYYDDWSANYDFTLNQWNYSAPKKSINLLRKKISYKPKKILDLACGTGLFGEELIKFYNKSEIYGTDISKKSIIIAKKKNIYKKLYNLNYEKKINYKIKFELVSMIGAMTYCKNYYKLFSNVKYYLLKKGHFIFSHRIDIWKKNQFDNVLENLEEDFKIKFISRPYNYLPRNNDFKNKIRIRLVLLQKC